MARSTFFKMNLTPEEKQKQLDGALKTFGIGIIVMLVGFCASCVGAVVLAVAL